MMMLVLRDERNAMSVSLRTIVLAVETLAMFPTDSPCLEALAVLLLALGVLTGASSFLVSW